MEDRTGTRTKVGEYLTKQYLSWRTGPDKPPLMRGTDIPMTAFADWLELDPAQLSNYINGHRLPGEATARKLADKLNDNGLLEILGMPPLMPRDPVIQAIIKIMWSKQITDEQRREMLEAARRIAKGKPTSAEI